MQGSPKIVMHQEVDARLTLPAWSYLPSSYPDLMWASTARMDLPTYKGTQSLQREEQRYIFVVVEGSSESHSALQMLNKQMSKRWSVPSDVCTCACSHTHTLFFFAATIKKFVGIWRIWSLTWSAYIKPYFCCTKNRIWETGFSQLFLIGISPSRNTLPPSPQHDKRTSPVFLWIFVHICLFAHLWQGTKIVKQGQKCDPDMWNWLWYEGAICGSYQTEMLWAAWSCDSHHFHQ